MSDEVIITSVALYFKSKQGDNIPLRWFERATELFVELNLSPILFTAGGGEFLLDDCYVLADHGHNLTMFDTVIKARKSELVKALKNGEIEDLGLDSPQTRANDREEWRATVSANVISGNCYVGIDEQLVSDASALLRRAYSISKWSFDVCYGIAYKLPLLQYPDGYASGFVKTSFSEVREMIRHRLECNLRKKTPDELWQDELYGERRHLTGLFRGAYPASILSESHLQSADLRSLGIGRLSKLSGSLWLWELSDSEIPLVQAILESKGILVSQACKS